MAENTNPKVRPVTKEGYESTLDVIRKVAYYDEKRQEELGNEVTLGAAYSVNRPNTGLDASKLDPKEFMPTPIGGNDADKILAMKIDKQTQIDTPERRQAKRQAAYNEYVLKRAREEKGLWSKSDADIREVAEFYANQKAKKQQTWDY